MRNPLKVLAAQAEDLRALCAKLAALSEDDAASDLGAMFSDLAYNLPLHFEVESEDLIPLLTVRLRRHDDLSHVLAIIAVNHRDGAIEMRRLRPLVETLEQTGGLSADRPAFVRSLKSLAECLLHHFSLVKAVVLPIAELRLTADDLRHLAVRMAAKGVT